MILFFWPLFFRNSNIVELFVKYGYLKNKLFYEQKFDFARYEKVKIDIFNLTEWPY